MIDDRGVALGVGMFAGAGIMAVVLGTGWSHSYQTIQNEAIARGYAEIVVEDNKRIFRWKE